ncbi:hypothetical protein ACLOJK_000789 [Asimina triloba]
METPSVTRRVTRSQALAASRSIPNSKKKKEETEMALSRTRKAALFDITNESPIVGITAAAGGLGAPSSLVRKSIQAKQTPGSGETILRNQVKTLLHKVEEEDDNVSTISLAPLPLHIFLGLSPSPVALLAPTPANTPLIPNLSNGVGDDVMEVGGDGQNCKNTQAAVNGMKQDVLDPCENLITRALLFDSPNKSEASDSSSSVVTTQGTSVWSIQVPKSSKGEEEDDDDDDGEEEEEDDDEDGEEEEEDDDDDDGYGDEEQGEEIEELCDELRKISVVEKKEMAKFEGRHTRFIYNSDSEMEGEEEDVAAEEVCSVSPSILRLNGMPTPAGKHLRFSTEAEEEDII